MDHCQQMACSKSPRGSLAGGRVGLLFTSGWEGLAGPPQSRPCGALPASYPWLWAPPISGAEGIRGRETPWGAGVLPEHSTGVLQSCHTTKCFLNC